MNPAEPVRPRLGRALIIALPIAFGVIQWIAPFGPPPPASRALILVFAMALWWVAETFPFHWVALLPLLWPLMVMDLPAAAPFFANLKVAGVPYFNPFILIFFGGMLIGTAMEQHGLHKRIALNIIRAVGSNPRRILLGFILSTAFISMWISNTATAVMMVPIGLAMISELEAREGRKLPFFAQSVMLSIAWAANIGGIGTLIGTPPNMAFAGFVGKQYDLTFGFLQYLVVGLPFMLMMLPAAYALVAWLCRRERIEALGRDIVEAELAKLGPMRGPEKGVLAIFALTSAGWILSQPILAFLKQRGLEIKGENFDAMVALSAGAALFITDLLRAPALRRFSFDVLILLGGSYALAGVVQAGGLSNWMATLLAGAQNLDPLLLMLMVTGATVLMTAFAANAASAQLMMMLVIDAVDPTRTAAGRAIPYLSAIAISSSCDFALPCGTPPNAIVFGTKLVRMRTMALAGVVLDVLAALTAALWVYYGASRLLPWVMPALSGHP